MRIACPTILLSTLLHEFTMGIIRGDKAILTHQRYNEKGRFSPLNCFTTPGIVQKFSNKKAWRKHHVSGAENVPYGQSKKESGKSVEMTYVREDVVR
jgi:hypothetical protein